MSQIDQKRNFNKLKQDLDPWRHVILATNDFLSWDKNFYPALIMIIVSLFYLLLWYLDLSVVTTLSLLGLAYMMFNFLQPTIKRLLLQQTDEWSSKQEAKFEYIVSQLYTMKLRLNTWHEYLFQNKERKSTVFTFAISALLLMLAWIGAIINNVLLMYVVTLTIVLYPGFRRKNTVQHLRSTVSGLFATSSSSSSGGKYLKESRCPTDKCD